LIPIGVGIAEIGKVLVAAIPLATATALLVFAALPWELVAAPEIAEGLE
jgi:hypothetical protein